MYFSFRRLAPVAFLFLLTPYLCPYIAAWQILQLEPLLCTARQLLIHPRRGSGSTWKQAAPKAPAGTAVPKDTQVNVAIYWGSAGAASCLQLGNPAFCCSWAAARKGAGNKYRVHASSWKIQTSRQGCFEFREKRLGKETGEEKGFLDLNLVLPSPFPREKSHHCCGGHLFQAVTTGLHFTIMVFCKRWLCSYLFLLP